ncbi:tape measure protein [Deinococcus peraridilitoris]|uniref:Tape measure domain protein n=1 Tax=Deinococcus peraridilitoris (strain DSM 19664 / LMG 22246 / CIP 109416 / KR-200) TaxID=937777 RepID=K9ZYR5_DEIPD|nr:tape measure protein [Deinococcus peraridilitoris]AFZ66062.1 tape measure domain protein [Deinococcus peraridilitoris DSM 19664]
MTTGGGTGGSAGSGTLLETLYVNVQANLGQLRSQLQLAVSSSVDASRQIAGAMAGISAAFVGVGAYAVKLAADLEQAEIAFTTLLGSGEKAKAFLKELSDFAARTPFELPGLQAAARKLLAFGFEAKQVIPMLTAIGDAVGALGGGEAEISRVTMALGQMMAKGKVSAEEMMQLAELGIPAWDMLAKAIGKSVPEAMKLAEKGAISASQAIPGILEQMNTRFAGSMEKQSKTLNGLWSTLKDNLTQTLTSIGTKIVETFDLHAVITGMTNGMQRIKEAIEGADLRRLFDEHKEKIEAVAWAVGGVLLPAVLSLAAGFAATLVTILPWIAAGLALKVAFEEAQKQTEGLQIATKDTGPTFVNMGTVLKGFVQLIQGVIQSFVAMAAHIGKSLGYMSVIAQDYLGGLARGLKALARGDFQGMVDASKDMRDSVSRNMNLLQDDLVGVWENPNKNVVGGFKTMMAGIKGEADTGVQNVVSSVSNGAETFKKIMADLTASLPAGSFKPASISTVFPKGGAAAATSQADKPETTAQRTKKIKDVLGDLRREYEAGRLTAAQYATALHLVESQNQKAANSVKRGTDAWRAYMDVVGGARRELEQLAGQAKATSDRAKAEAARRKREAEQAAREAAQAAEQAAREAEQRRRGVRDGTEAYEELGRAINRTAKAGEFSGDKRDGFLKQLRELRESMGDKGLNTDPSIKALDALIGRLVHTAAATSRLVVKQREAREFQEQLREGYDAGQTALGEVERGAIDVADAFGRLPTAQRPVKLEFEELIGLMPDTNEGLDAFVQAMMDLERAGNITKGTLDRLIGSVGELKTLLDGSIDRSLAEFGGMATDVNTGQGVFQSENEIRGIGVKGTGGAADAAKGAIAAGAAELLRAGFAKLEQSDLFDQLARLTADGLADSPLAVLIGDVLADKIKAASAASKAEAKLAGEQAAQVYGEGWTAYSSELAAAVEDTLAEVFSGTDDEQLTKALELLLDPGAFAKLGDDGRAAFMDAFNKLATEDALVLLPEETIAAFINRLVEGGDQGSDVLVKLRGALLAIGEALQGTAQDVETVSDASSDWDANLRRIDFQEWADGLHKLSDEHLQLQLEGAKSAKNVDRFNALLAEMKRRAEEAKGALGRLFEKFSPLIGAVGAFAGALGATDLQANVDGFVTLLGKGLDIAKDFASGNIIGGITKIISGLADAIMGFRKAYAEAARLQEQFRESLSGSFLNADDYGKTSVRSRGFFADFFGGGPEVVQEINKVGLAFAKTISDGFTKGIKEGLKEAIVKNDVSLFASTLKLSVGDAVLNGIIDAFMQGELLKNIIGPAIKKYTDALQTPDPNDDVAALNGVLSAADTAAALGEKFVTGLAPVRQMLVDKGFIKPPEGTESITGNRELFGRVPDLGLGSISTPTLEAFDTLGNQIVPAFGRHVDRFGEIINTPIRVVLDGGAQGSITGAFR